MKRLELDLRANRRELLDGNATNERLKDQLKESVHKINIHRIENEALIKQIDLADAKTAEKEDELRLLRLDFDSKMKSQLERITMRREKQEEREVFEVKRKAEIAERELNGKIQELQEEADFYKQKTDRLEIENGKLKHRGDSGVISQLQEEIA